MTPILLIRTFKITFLLMSSKHRVSQQKDGIQKL